MFLGAGERALAMAEQFALDQVLGQRAAIDRHKGHLGPKALVVHSPGGQFLAGARVAEDQDGRVGGRHLGDQLSHTFDLPRLAD